MPNSTFPLENPDAVSPLAVPATSDQVLVYDVSAGQWKISTVAQLQAVAGWTA